MSDRVTSWVATGSELTYENVNIRFGGDSGRRVISCPMDGWIDSGFNFYDLYTVFFSPEFLIAPNRNWQVTYGEPEDKATGWMSPGTLVKLADPPRIWRLTGHTDFTTGYLEGTWPD